MGVRQIFLSALRYYRENFLKLIGIAAPGTLIGGLVFQAIWLLCAKTGKTQYLQFLGTQHIVFAALLSLIMTAAGVIIISENLLGKSVSVGQAYSRILNSLFPLLGALLLFTFAISVGLIVVIPGIVVYVWFCLAAPVVIIEREGGFGALRRSRVLVKGFFDKAFLLIVWLTLAEAFVVILVLSLPFLVGSFPGFPSLLSLLSIWLTIPINAFRVISTTMLYYDLRVRKEGYDLQVLAQELATPL
jgi:hypothetical protein